MRQTTIPGSPDESVYTWTATTTTPAVSSIAINLTAKGAAQFDIKLQYDGREALLAEGQQDIERAIAAVRVALAQAGIPLAGAESASNGNGQGQSAGSAATSGGGK